MPIQTSYPGVYLQEVASSVHTITGVSTGTGCFIGRAAQGPDNQPQLCTSYNQFTKIFGTDTSFSDLPTAVYLFFLNGGTKCWVTRIVNNGTSPAVAATANILDVGGGTTLVATAISKGAIGNTVCLSVDYNTAYPESTFNLTVFNYGPNASGQLQMSNIEAYTGLTMNPASANYVISVVNNASALIQLVDNKLAPTPLPDPVIQSGRPMVLAGATGLGNLLTTNNKFMLSTDGGQPTLIDLTGASTATTAAFVTAVENAITTTIPALAGTTAAFSAALTDGTMLFSINIKGATEARITPAPGTDDLSVPFMLGTGQGGLEISAYADYRPAPTGIVFDITQAASLNQIEAMDNTPIANITSVTINGANVPVTLAGGPLFYQASATSSDGLRTNWAALANAINNPATPIPNFNWRANVWGSRLALTPMDGQINRPNTITTLPTNVAAGTFLTGVRYLGLAGGLDGGPATTADYNMAFTAIDQTVDIFNLLVLPKDNTQPATPPAPPQAFYGIASAYCQTRRAFLVMDPPAAWTTVQKAIDPFNGINNLRIGLVNDHAAVYYPNLVINNSDGTTTQVGPAGAIAGLMARIDVSRGVWKAPAGTEATIQGANSLQYRLNDSDSGQLNPVAINALRIFPDGIVSWGARTADGDDSFASQWKYVPIRRLALYIEESLYEGLRWVVFEPNDTPLWAAIRLNVGGFMNGLFRQGAFQGQSKDEAYFVKCDSDTTTSTDQDNGIVNIWVGFAPLKPAEFVVIYIQQMAGQTQN